MKKNIDNFNEDFKSIMNLEQVYNYIKNKYKDLKIEMVSNTIYININKLDVFIYDRYEIQILTRKSCFRFFVKNWIIDDDYIGITKNDLNYQREIRFWGTKKCNNLCSYEQLLNEIIFIINNNAKIYIKTNENKYVWIAAIFPQLLYSLNINTFKEFFCYF